MNFVDGSYHHIFSIKYAPEIILLELYSTKYANEIQKEEVSCYIFIVAVEYI